MHARVGNTCIYFKPGNTVRGGTQFPRELSPLIGFVQPGNSVRGTVFPRELGPGGTVFPKGIRSAGPKIGPDRIPYGTGLYVKLNYTGLTIALVCNLKREHIL